MFTEMEGFSALDPRDEPLVLEVLAEHQRLLHASITFPTTQV